MTEKGSIEKTWKYFPHYVNISFLFCQKYVINKNSPIWTLKNLLYQQQKKQTIQLKIGQRTLADTFPMKTYK